MLGGVIDEGGLLDLSPVTLVLHWFYFAECNFDMRKCFSIS